MAIVNWIKGSIEPSESGEYYIIIEAQNNIGDYKKGDIEIDSDWYDKESNQFDTIGKNNKTWKVIAWANILLPDIPKDLQDRVKSYMGKRIQ